MRSLMLLVALMALMTMSVACDSADNSGNDGMQDQAAAEVANAGQDAAADMDDNAEHEDADDDAGDMNDDDAEHEDGDDDSGDMNDDDAEHEDGDDAGDMNEDAEQEDGDMNEDAEHEDADEGGEGADESGGQGMAHRRNEDEQHNQMLDEAIALGLLTEADKLFFLETHEVLDETSPRAMDESGKADADTKKALQRGRTDVAVAEGALSQEDADRFTEIHDILIDNELMDH